jgi:hypothetical protein
MEQEAQSAGSTAKTSSAPMVWLAVAFSLLIGVCKAFVWSREIRDGSWFSIGQVAGYATGSVIPPVLIAYAIAGRKKVMGRGYAFAAWVAGLSVLSWFILIWNSRH